MSSCWFLKRVILDTNMENRDMTAIAISRIENTSYLPNESHKSGLIFLYMFSHYVCLMRSWRNEVFVSLNLISSQQVLFLANFHPSEVHMLVPILSTWQDTHKTYRSQFICRVLKSVNISQWPKPPAVLFWCLFPSLLHNSRNKHQTSCGRINSSPLEPMHYFHFSLTSYWNNLRM